jgi:hypothetical protein
MTSLSIQPPFPVIPDGDGQPLENGYIWIGVANLDPQTNPIAVYWDAAGTIPAASLLRAATGKMRDNRIKARINRALTPTD